MTGESVHALTNLSRGYDFEITVPVGQDVAAVAKAALVERDVPEDAQEGFFVSVFPTSGPAGSLEDDVPAATDDSAGQLRANPPSNLDSSPNDTPYDTQGPSRRV